MKIKEVNPSTIIYGDKIKNNYSKKEIKVSKIERLDGMYLFYDANGCHLAVPSSEKVLKYCIPSYVL